MTNHLFLPRRKTLAVFPEEACGLLYRRFSAIIRATTCQSRQKTGRGRPLTAYSKPPDGKSQTARLLICPSLEGLPSAHSPCLASVRLTICFLWMAKLSEAL